MVYAVQISEIMYDPQGSDAGREWIEVYNDTGSAIDFTVWKFFESATNHGITSSSGGTTVAVGSYAVIADNPQKFLIDYPSYTGVLYDSSFSLSNSGEQLIIKDSALNAIDSIIYSGSLGGADDGTTLSLISGSWVGGVATPGQANSASSGTTTATTTVATSTPPSQVVASTGSPIVPPAPDINLLPALPQIVVAGAAATFAVKSVTSSGKAIDNVLFSWSFGEGGNRQGKSVAYTYGYPGVYIASVVAESDTLFSKEKMRIFVVSPEVAITSYGNDVAGPYVDITNSSPYELDMSGWVIRSDGGMFFIPKYTIIAASSTTRFLGSSLGMSTSTLPAFTNIALLFPDHSVASRYQARNSTTTTPAATTTSVRVPMVAGAATSSATVKKASVVRTPPHSTVKQVQAATTTAPQVVQAASSKDVRILGFIKGLFGYTK